MEQKQLQEQRVMETACRVMSARGLSYDYDKKEGEIYFELPCDAGNLTARFSSLVENQWVRIVVGLPVDADPAKKGELALAVSLACFRMKQGGFCYDPATKVVCFRWTQSFQGSLIGEGLIHRMLDVAKEETDAHYDHFFRIGKGMEFVEDYLEKQE